MQKIIALLFAAFLLVGCELTPTPKPAPAATIHPSWPLPVMPYKFDWKVIVLNETEVYVALEYDQSVEFRVFLEDIKRYIEESNGMICFYRKEIKEPKCYKAVDTSTK